MKSGEQILFEAHLVASYEESLRRLALVVTLTAVDKLTPALRRFEEQMMIAAQKWQTALAPLREMVKRMEEAEGA